ncbi:alpha/beta hydrolase [Algoriphagus sp. CAU 1675]|uniref:alpha/beta fold hydrolase n=1 Tax=Algoriphagus sp. CAU 1675 TaxID=3032597 RepID=UPI0023DB6E2E|nr:alpha/beta hydrolase [Algoriphagus sp. CAU 1675]MDF2156470.1 alpha/beta hydrolase [Algoriphagus sp. CAU 1675]
MRIAYLFLCFQIGFVQLLFSQEVKEKFLLANGVNLHYLDFGGEGSPIIFMQSFHEDASEWYTGEMAGIANEFLPNYRVLAVTRRGWGKSDHTKWGYDVATQSEDLLGFMDALGLKKAVLIGRIPANQDMIWIAEHHPDRIAAMIMIGNPYLGLNSSISEIREYETELLAMSWDLGERALEMRGPRGSWSPHFLKDSTKGIDISTLRFLSKMDVESLPGGRNLFYMDRTIRQVSAPDFKPWNDRVAKAAMYFRELGKDQGRQEFIRAYLMEHDPGPTFRASLERAFGENLKTTWEPEIPENADPDLFWIEVYAPFFVDEIKAFLREHKL